MSNTDKELQIIIHSKEKNEYFYPAVLDGVSWSTQWKGQAGKFVFKLVEDDKITFNEGDVVQANYGGENFFYGFIFIIKRDRNKTASITCYDQIRYLKNKDTYVFTNGKASEWISRIASDFGIKTGEMIDTGYTIPKYRGSNKTLMDICQDLIDMSMENTGRLYCLYDDFGKLTLKDIESMSVNILVDNETAENFSYDSSIDKDTYNKVKLIYDNKETGKRDVWIAQDSANIGRWGTLQLTETVNPKKSSNFPEMADTKLMLHNRVRRSLTIKSSFGDLRVRAGSMLYVDLQLGDIQFAKKVICEQVTHTFTNNFHTMDLTVKGDVITG